MAAISAETVCIVPFYIILLHNVARKDFLKDPSGLRTLQILRKQSDHRTSTTPENVYFTVLVLLLVATLTLTKPRDAKLG